MVIKKIMNHIKSIPKDIKHNPHINPSKIMHKLDHYVALASKDYYGNSFADKMHYFYRNGKQYAVISYHFAELVMTPYQFKQTKGKYNDSDYFVQLMIPHKVITRKINLKDVLNAQKRALHAEKQIKAKDQYDKNDTLEIERDIHNQSMDLTIPDLAFILYSYKVSKRKHSKQLIHLVHSFEDNLNGISSSINLSNKGINLIIKLLEQSKSKVFKDIPVEDQKDWHRCLNKLKAYYRQCKKEDSISNPLVKKALQNLHNGNMRKTFDTLLTNMHVDHHTDHNHCYDFLSRTTLNTMMYGIAPYQFVSLDDIITGTKYAADCGDPVQIKDYHTLKHFAKHGYRYATLVFNDDNTIKEIKPIGKKLGSLIIRKILVNYKNHRYPDF